MSAAPDPEALRRPELYVNREFAALEFNRRVLELASDPAVPPLERLRFLCLSCTSLDKFFEIRVGGLKERLEHGTTYLRRDGLSAVETLAGIARTAHALVDEQYRVFNEALAPELASHGVRFLPRGEWNPAQTRWARSFFRNEVLPVLTPIGLDPAHPFPRILNKALNFIVEPSGVDAFGREAPLAVVQAPRALARVIRVPAAVEGTGRDDFVFLSSIIHAFVGDLFPGLELLGCHQFRVTRNTDLLVADEDAEDLLRAVEGELASRPYGDEVRLEVAQGCPPHLVRFLLNRFGLTSEDLYEVNGPVNLNRLSQVAELVDRPDLKYPAFTPGRPRHLRRADGMMAAMRRGDLLLHHPYESFAPVLELLREAAADPAVLAIRQTLYRTGPDSPVVDALVEAARAGKEVTVVVELMARFDEAENIKLANRLQQAGAHVVYGVVGYKTHAKMLLVVRREEGRLRRYVHLGTGNYHPETARRYADYSLFTCNARIGRDVHQVLMLLTSPGARVRTSLLSVAPLGLHERTLELVRREAEHAAQGRPARIVAKLNALVEPEVIEALYAASCAGVRVDLLVRGTCCLRPGVPGASENIRVRSLVGRFLEHARVFLFANGGKEEVYLGSADWMERNFFTRVEVLFPVTRAALRRRLAQDLELELADDRYAWEMQPDSSWRRAAAAAGISAQEARLASLAQVLSGS
ncbi:polyphosphate kinase 1 [Thioalkalivibrio sp. XN279]|uniref:polyphosphate kinase 1 n=1 Tax=Thioalkalivibrio sp. XN279 TaxID=2714953 RepID=UPI00140885C8|nr:polyphosphate kinase 1 [Thioalkalivibrio sp. XN279]NHA14227.1 polyphosphate kinase 1 [Thioalkalivibrio sp. XN279]